jgi:predicted dehydrogenase
MRNLLIALLLVAGSVTQQPQTKIAIIGLDHDHVWGLLHDIKNEPAAALVAIADSHPELIERARKVAPEGTQFYSDYIHMLDEARPEAVFVTTSNERHLEILRECARRHIHYSTEKPMALNAADAREMARLAQQAGIKLMVNYWNAWVAPTHELFHRVHGGELGTIQKLVVQYGHQGPKEIGVSPQFAAWLYDPAKNGGGALVDFGCYGAELSLWLKGRPQRVYASTRKLKTDQHNAVDDDALIVLDYPDATSVIEASWDWPFTKEEVDVYGTKGSAIAMRRAFFARPAGQQAPSPQGAAVTLAPPPHATSNPVAYMIDRIRTNQPIEPPLSADINVGVLEILDAARESIRTGNSVVLSAQ